MIECKYYKTEDGCEFSNKENAEHYENHILWPLQFLEKKCLGERLKIWRGIGEAPCTDFKQHKQEDILNITMKLITIVNNHQLKYEPKMSRSFYDKCMEIIGNINTTNDIQEQHKLFESLCIWMKRLSYIMYEDEMFNPDMSIATKIYDRLDRISFRTGKEFPDSKYVNREEKFDEFVNYTKDYIAKGGRYR